MSEVTISQPYHSNNSQFIHTVYIIISRNTHLGHYLYRHNNSMSLHKCRHSCVYILYGKCMMFLINIRCRDHVKMYPYGNISLSLSIFNRFLSYLCNLVRLIHISDAFTLMGDQHGLVHMVLERKIIS